MTMPRVLILRSVSLQQLDVNLPAIASAFPGAAFDLLTHPHAVAECRKFTGIDRVIPLDSPAPFSPLRLPAGLRRERYAAVVVPVANCSGAGFLNVFLAAWATGAGAVYRCDVASAVERMPRWSLALRALAAVGFPAAALALMVPLAPLALGGMLLGRLLAAFGAGRGRRG